MPSGLRSVTAKGGSEEQLYVSRLWGQLIAPALFSSVQFQSLQSHSTQKIK